MADRYLYLARHAEATEDETELTARGRRQAALLGERMRRVPLSAIHHGPLPRATQTAHIVAEHVGLTPHEVACAGDYPPHVPRHVELPEDSAGMLLDFVGQFTPQERAAGSRLAAEAVERFTGPAEQPVHELVVTHAFLVGWLLRDALDAPPWRWLGFNAAHAALTVLRYAAGRPTGVLVVNDVAHLPEELRWTGFPPRLRL